MSKTNIVLNRQGVRDMLRSDAAKQICGEYAQNILQRCGDGYAGDTFTGKNRVNAMVYAQTRKAILDNAENNTILKALR